jgi:hypothetical protein
MRIVTVKIPDGYADAHEFAKDCGLELVKGDAMSALRDLVDACEYVSPIAGAVATEASVKHIREASRFMKAIDNARTVLAGN